MRSAIAHCLLNLFIKVQIYLLFSVFSSNIIYKCDKIIFYNTNYEN